MDLFSLLDQIDPFSYLAIAVLVAMSILSWAVAFEKMLRLREVARKTSRYITYASEQTKLQDLVSAARKNSDFPAQKTVLLSVKELNRLNNEHSFSVASAFLERCGSATINDFLRTAESKLGILASIGATAPFVGLFGTVTGVIHTLYQMGSEAGAAQFNVVAPGLSVALIVTALGLFVALPAVLWFNFFRSRTRAIQLELIGFQDQIFNSLLLRFK